MNAASALLLRQGIATTFGRLHTFFDLYNSSCCSCWLRCSLKSRWVLPITVLPKTSVRNQRKKPFGHFRSSPSFSRNNCEVKVHHKKSLCPLEFVPIQWTIKRQLWIANPVTENFHSSQEWKQCRQQWSKHPNKVPPNVSQLCLQAPGHLFQKTRNTQKTSSLLTHLNYTYHVTKKSVPLSCHADFLIKLFSSPDGFLICTTETYLCVGKIKIVKAYKITILYSFCHYQGRSMRNKDKEHL